MVKVGKEGKGWRTQVVPCFEASTQEEAKEKRLLVETLRLTVDVDEETLGIWPRLFFRVKSCPWFWIDQI